MLLLVIASCMTNAQEIDSVLLKSQIVSYRKGSISKDSLISSYLQFAELLKKKHDLVGARHMLKDAEDLFDDTNHQNYARVLWLKGEIAMDLDDRAEAISYLLKALDIYQTHEIDEHYMQVLLLLAHNYNYIGDHPTAREFYNDCLSLAKELGDSKVEGSCIYNIGNTYVDDGSYDLAVQYLGQAKELAEQNEDLELLHKVHHVLAINFSQQNNFQKAGEHYRKSLAISLQMKDVICLGFSYQGLGFMYLSLGQLDSAEYYMNRTLMIGEQTSNEQLKDNAREVIEQVYYQTHRYQQAYDLFKLRISKRDSLFNIQNTQMVESMRARYQDEKSERQLIQKSLELEAASNDLVRHRNWQIILVCLVLSLILILFLIYRGYVLRKRANDILRTKNAEIERHLQEIENVTANKTRWFVNVAHELRTPLTLIKGPVQKILGSEELTSDMRSDLELVRRNAKRLANLVNEILDLSKMEEGEMKVKESIFLLDELVDRVIASFESRAHQLGIQLKSTLHASDSIQVQADYEKLQKVLVNLISNALKFTPPGGAIEVYLARSKSGIKMVVKDNGKGINAEDIDRVFDRFYQATNDGVVGGTGVGLALSKEIAEMHGGTLTVTSTPGMGSTFTLTLPDELVNHQVYGDSSSELLNSLPANVVNSSERRTLEKKPILLLVEDNEDMVEYIVSLLQPHFELRKASSGVQALEVLSTQDVRFIISDIMMPEMDGVSFLKKVKENDSWKFIPFIHLTALSDQNLRKELLRIGVDDYLLKPFDPEELSIRVRNLYQNFVQRSSLTSSEPTVVPFDEKVISRLKKNVLDNLEDTNFNVLRLADAAAMSERQLYRFLKSTTGYTPLQFIQEIKLNHANELARKKAHLSISELAAAVGFKQASYFSNLFEKRFGKKPGAILKA